MTSQHGGGLGRFARRKTEASTSSPPPAPAAAKTNESKKPPASPGFALASFGGVASFANDGMFGSSFDMSFGADYSGPDFDDFGVPDKPEETSDGANAVLGSSNDTSTTTLAGTDSSHQSTIQESTNTPAAATNKTNAGPFQLRGNQGTNPAPPHTSPPRPKTAAPQQSGNKSGLSMFARKRATSNQEPSAMAKQTPVDSRITANNGQSLMPTEVSTTTTTTTAPTPPAPVEDSNKNKTPGSTFTRVLPPPSIGPSKPMQRGVTMPSVTPKAASVAFLPPLSDKQNDFSTPLPRTGNTDSSVIQKTSDMTTTFVTPESTMETTTPTLTGGTSNNNNEVQDSSLNKSFLGELGDTAYDGKEPDGFDDILSVFLGDLRSATDLQLFSEAELLDLEVDLSQAFAGTLHGRSNAMDMLDHIEDFHVQADGIITGLQDF